MIPGYECLPIKAILKLCRHAESCRESWRVTPDTIDEFTLEMMQRFI